MSTSHPYQDHPSSNPIADEHRWIIHIRRSLDEDIDNEPDSPVSIFSVPKALLLTNPESYIPQQISLGPYHHTRPELYDMQRCKLSAAKRFQRRVHGLKFHNIVDHLIPYEPKLRAFYQKYLNFNGETLTWMMAIDSCFLLEFLEAFARKMPSRTLWLRDITGRKSGHDAIVRDILMLENQVPLSLLKKIMAFQSATSAVALHSILTDFFNAISPFELVVMPDLDQLERCTHLLDLLYHSIVPEIEDDDEEEYVNEEGEKRSIIKRLVFSNPVRLILTFPFKVISNLPGVILMRHVLEHVYEKEEHANGENNYNNNNNNNNNKEKKDADLLIEEIRIPSVSELASAGIKFEASKRGILGIGFDSGTGTLRLASVRLDVNSGVVLRNLVAYEACGVCGGKLVLARYFELMNGIVDGPEDARLLRESGIVFSYLRCDGDVADLWNGMSASVRMTKVPFLDRVIQDVNRYYEGSWRVKMRKGFSWRRLALVCLLLFIGLQGFYSLFPMFYMRRRL
ncbi:hypothetical protein STAS_15929 [Striga asiatica]|uniref:Uncharacterized protein n=1 Tax=Striga asiatica TaxID=4170 RepID=A0A5A7Q3E4_STRAF|nr:hypothetical protein STAS_15929 [Striga asiatica]